MSKEEIIDGLAGYGLTYRDDYLTNDICFDYDGCESYPISFPDWEHAGAFLDTISFHTED